MKSIKGKRFPRLLNVKVTVMRAFPENLFWAKFMQRLKSVEAGKNVFSHDVVFANKSPQSRNTHSGWRRKLFIQSSISLTNGDYVSPSVALLMFHALGKSPNQANVLSISLNTPFFGTWHSAQSWKIPSLSGLKNVCRKAQHSHDTQKRLKYFFSFFCCYQPKKRRIFFSNIAQTWFAESSFKREQFSSSLRHEAEQKET